MPGPTFTFGFVMATLYGAAFHLIMGGSARRLVFFMLAGWLGFTLGHILGVLFEVNLFVIGALQFTSASVTTLALLWMAHLLTLDDKTEKTRSVRKR